MIRMSLTVAALVLLSVTMATAAAAKGPESAILTGPGIDESIVFIDQSRPHETYETEPPLSLIGLTALWLAPVPSPTDPPDELGAPYTVTWHLFGALPDRQIVQHVYLDAAGGPVIHTPEQVGLEGWGPDVVGWFPAPEGLKEAIDEIVAWGLPVAPTPAWVLPVIAFTAISSLIGLGSRLSPSGSAGRDQLGQ